jgi:sulfide:quinone oxidoreductase
MRRRVCLPARAGGGAAGRATSVDPGGLATAYPGVFAVGDVTQIKLANGLPLPKAGIIAEPEGTRVAAAIAADVRGEGAPAPFDGHGHCFIEMGRFSATLIECEFYAEPEPSVQIREPSAGNAEEQRRVETERLARWFQEYGRRRLPLRAAPRCR